MITHRLKLNSYNLTIDQITLLNSINYNEANYELLKTSIYKYLKNNLPIEYLCKNWNEILLLGRDSSSLHSCITRYGQEVGTKLFEEKTKKSTHNREYFIDKMGEEAALKHLSRHGSSLENFIYRHGEENGIKLWNEYCLKRAKTFADGKEQNKYASRNLKWYQEKYGEEKGYEVWDHRRKKQGYKVSKQYYIDTYGPELGPILLHKCKARGLDFYINKYGEIEGTLRYKKRMSAFIDSGNKHIQRSKWALECGNHIKEHVPDLYYYGNNETRIPLNESHFEKLNKIYIVPDLIYGDKIIEFQGDVFHGNPNLYKDDDIVHPYKKLTARELRELDAIRFEVLKELGYTILEVWENDYNISKEQVIQTCVNFLK